MANFKEKVKAFLSDEEKVQAIANNQKFLDAISGGTTSPETISEEFEKLGLPMSKSDASKICETAQKLINTPPDELIEHLNESDLSAISGGTWDDITDNEIGGSILASGISTTTGLGCWIAARACQLSAERAKSSGNTSKYEKLTKAVDGLDISAGVCLGAAALSSAVVFGHKLGK